MSRADRPATAASAVLAAVLATAGCSTPEPVPGSTAPPLAEVSASPPAPSSTRTPGPAVTDVCALLSAEQVSTALKLPATTPRAEPPYGSQPAGDLAGCRYQASAGYLILSVASVPMDGRRADVAVQQIIGRYSGTLEPVGGLGDAAFFAGGGTTVQTLAVVIDQGSLRRQMVLTAFMPSATGAKDGLVSLAGVVAPKV